MQSGHERGKFSPDAEQHHDGGSDHGAKEETAHEAVG
jgi:hypothetical protein